MEEAVHTVEVGRPRRQPEEPQFLDAEQAEALIALAENWERSMYDDFVAGVEQASLEFDLPRPPLAAIGVAILFEEGILVEAEVTAVVDR